jgi:transcriptional regulator with XRE-family HTH domain
MRVDVPGRSPEGALLREYRIRADLTQRMLGDRAGYAASMVAQVEVGFWRPNDLFVGKIAAALGLTLAEEQRLLSLRAQAWKGRRRPRRTMKTLLRDLKAQQSTSDSISDAA